MLFPGFVWAGSLGLSTLSIHLPDDSSWQRRLLAIGLLIALLGLADVLIWFAGVARRTAVYSFLQFTAFVGSVFFLALFIGCR